MNTYHVDVGFSDGNIKSIQVEEETVYSALRAVLAIVENCDTQTHEIVSLEIIDV